MIKRSVLYLLAICILSVIHKLRKYDVWVPSDPSQPPSLPRATDFPGLMWTGKPVGRKTPPFRRAATLQFLLFSLFGEAFLQSSGGRCDRCASVALRVGGLGSRRVSLP